LGISQLGDEPPWATSLYPYYGTYVGNVYPERPIRMAGDKWGLFGNFGAQCLREA